MQRTLLHIRELTLRTLTVVKIHRVTHNTLYAYGYWNSYWCMYCRTGMYI